jgi:AAA15 family ATPase/GTPase
MLLRFSFENYKSFRDNVILDMTAAKISEHADRVVQVGNEKILPVAAIYGANASGKSNVLEAFRYMRRYVIRSFGFGGDADLDSKKKKFLPTPFLFDKNSHNEPSIFDIYYITSDEEGAKTFHYGFSVGKQGIEEEWLNYRAKTARGAFRDIFYRNTNTGELNLSGIPKKVRENIEVSLEPETLIVSLGAKLKVAKLKDVREWFLRTEFADFGNPGENLVLSSVAPENFLDTQVQQAVVKYVASFDPSIIGFDVEEIPKEDERESSLKIRAIHHSIGTNENVSIPLGEESAGTLKMFALYPSLHAVFENGGVLFVDELSGKLHPLLVRNLLITFLNTNVNKKHAQIVYTTHEPWGLNNGLLRRDEIWFTEKAMDGTSSLYSLADFVTDDKKIRKDENYEKNYLLGKYGAIPDLVPLFVSEGSKPYGKS